MSSTEPPPAQPPTGPAHPAGSVSPLVSAKIGPRHLQRKAIVYVRQSSPQQVLNNKESGYRQYDLRNYAVLLGWPAESVSVIDDDQARTARTADARTGFQSLQAAVALDEVGIILGSELNRLSRCNRDWHNLLHVCAI